jgi:hypothetical protein
MSRRDHYSCTISRDERGSLVVVELVATEGDGDIRVTRATGIRLSQVAEPLRRLLATGGVNGRAWTGSKPLELDGRTGAHAELLLAAIRPLRRPDRLADIADAIVAMGAEEASYWHAKSLRRGGLRALRILLTEGAC